MTKVKFYDSVSDELLKFAVIISKTQGKWVFCKHKERDTYEVPGGHREEYVYILLQQRIILTDRKPSGFFAMLIFMSLRKSCTVK